MKVGLEKPWEARGRFSLGTVRGLVQVEGKHRSYFMYSARNAQAF